MRKVVKNTTYYKILLSPHIPTIYEVSVEGVYNVSYNSQYMW